MKKQVFFACGAVFLSFTVSYVILETSVNLLVYKRGDYLATLDPAFHKNLIAQDPPGYTEKPLYQCDPKVGAVQTPLNRGFWRGFSYPQAEFRNQIFINAEGFRSSQDYDNVQGMRVAVLGDSFVQGLQVGEQDTFVKVAEKALRESSRDVYVLNYGNSATGTVHQFAVFEEVMRKSRPQVVVLSFYPNDLIDDSPVYRHERPFLVPHYTVSPSGEFILGAFECEGKLGEVEPIILKPKVVKLSWRMVSFFTRMLDKAQFSLSFRFLSVFLKDKFLPSFEYDPTLDIYKKIYPPALEESLRFTTYLIDKMNRQCQKEGIKFFVVLIPAPEQAQPGMWQQYLRSRGGTLAAEDFYLNNPQQRLTQELSARGIPVVDFMPYYKVQSRKEMLYYPKDRHFNINGHRLAGRLLAEQLKRFLSR